MSPRTESKFVSVLVLLALTAGGCETETAPPGQDAATEQGPDAMSVDLAAGDIAVPDTAPVPDLKLPDQLIPDTAIPDLPPPTCTDGIKNGDEVDLDCGGGTCPACATGKKCKLAGDCTSLFCSNNICTEPTCTDGVKNGKETDVDCGGGTCTGCIAGKKCAAASDCKGGICSSAGICAAASCTDKVKNGDETDVDCGGGTCPTCSDSKNCAAATDCQSGVCSSAGLCATASCTDKVKNGSETDLDCGGGTCPTCADSKKCVAATDCQSGVCSSAGLCATASCTDKVQNGKETDLDCGGGPCPACAVGKKCTGPMDCASSACSSAGLCTAPSCTDKVKNGSETDVDCGGGSCPACAVGQKCGVNTDCQPNLCSTGACVYPASCAEILAAFPKATSGVYTILPKATGKPIKVHCDMTASGSTWTVVARSTTPSKWSVTNQYALGHYDHWIDKDNYTLDLRKLLAKAPTGASMQLRIYDHVNPAAMDARMFVKVSSFIGINLDDTTKSSTVLPKSLVSGTFDKSKKAYAVGQTIQYVMHVGQLDSYVYAYCSHVKTKSFINFLTGNPKYVHATVCSDGLGLYRNVNNPKLYPVYNNTDAGRRVSLAYRLSPTWKSKGTKTVSVRFGTCNKTDCTLASACTPETVGKEARITSSAEVKAITSDTGWAQGHKVSITGHLLTTTGNCKCGNDYNKNVSATVYSCEY